MPQGKGTYGDQVGRPKKRSGFKMKYQSDSFPFKEDSPLASKMTRQSGMTKTAESASGIDQAWGDPEEYFQKDATSDVLNSDVQSAMQDILKMTPKYK